MNISLKNPKQEHFAQLVSNGESPAQAYVLAGYSSNGALQGSSRLLKNVEVCSRVTYLRTLKEEKHAEAITEAMTNVGINKQWVLEELVDNVKIAKAAEPVLDKDGKPTGEYRTNIAAANKALELIGTELGMFITKIEKGMPGDFERLTDEELEKRIADNERAINAARSAITAAATSARKATSGSKT